MKLFVFFIILTLFITGCTHNDKPKEEPIEGAPMVTPIPEYQEKEEEQAEPQKPVQIDLKSEDELVKTGDKFYDEGYSNGYDTGYDDGSENSRDDSYDDSSRYKGNNACKYKEGYAEGYENGYDDGFADNGYWSEEEE